MNHVKSYQINFFHSHNFEGQREGSKEPFSLHVVSSLITGLTFGPEIAMRSTVSGPNDIPYGFLGSNADICRLGMDNWITYIH